MLIVREKFDRSKIPKQSKILHQSSRQSIKLPNPIQPPPSVRPPSSLLPLFPQQTHHKNHRIDKSAKTSEDLQKRYDVQRYDGIYRL